MKIKLIIMVSFCIMLFAVQRNMTDGTVITYESGLDTANVMTYNALIDSLRAHIMIHYDKEAVHEMEDSTTTAPTAYTVKSVQDGVVYANRIRTSFIEHLSQDSVHVNGADATTSIPSALSESTTNYDALKDYISKLITSITTHKARAMDTRYNILGKTFAASYIAHCARDTSDSDSVHWVPDETYNTVTFDSTNVDSTKASWNRLKSRFNSHIAFATGDGSEPHKEYTNADSITAADATTYTTLTLLVSDSWTKFDQHVMRLYTMDSDSVHYLAGGADTLAVAEIETTAGNHIIADATSLEANFAELGYSTFAVPDWIETAVIQINASSTSSGANFRCYGSIDGDNWVYADSTGTITGNAEMNPFVTNRWAFIKVYCNAYTDGTYNILLRGVRK